MSTNSHWHQLATLGPIGHLRPAPGTWGSLAGVLSGVALMQLSSYLLEFALLIVIFVGIKAASIYARDTGKKDAPEVIIDEVAGQWIPLLVIPTDLKWPAYCAWVAVAFVLFRFFDITKLGPIGMAEKISGGTGVMADDLVAGVFAGAAIIAIYYLWPEAVL
ncbi:phosphatidylglycerophosphatase A [Alphaproteobacteria bacterium]|nr:phosphatidylglycerophosphatase A [Alphaproteobacteria bacterium]